MALDVIDSQLDSQFSEFTSQSNIYFISSRRPKLDILKDENFQRNFASQHDRILEELGELEDYGHIDGIEMSCHMMDGTTASSIAYIAQMIEKKIESQVFYCDCCKLVFSENKKLDDNSICFIESKRPCSGTFYVCKIVDRFMKLYKPKWYREVDTSNTSESDDNNYGKDFRVLYYMIFKEIDFSRIFEESDFAGHEEHKFHLVKCIVQEFIRIKTSQVSKQLTLSQYDQLLRSKLTRWIHLQGQ